MSAVALGAVFAAGIAAGIWVFVSPWAVGFPTAGGGGWTSVVWSSAIVGGLVVLASGASLVAVLAHALHRSLAR